MRSVPEPAPVGAAELAPIRCARQRWPPPYRGVRRSVRVLLPGAALRPAYEPLSLAPRQSVPPLLYVPRRVRPRRRRPQLTLLAAGPEARPEAQRFARLPSSIWHPI